MNGSSAYHQRCRSWEEPMPIVRLTDYLDRRGVAYSLLPHRRTVTAAETAAEAHVPRRDLAKPVVVELDGELAMVVVPANSQVDLDLVAAETGARSVALVEERDFRERFPDCEPGAMPPLGNLWGIRVYADESLADGECIAFNAGVHHELMWLAWRDFERLVEPQVGRFARVPVKAET